MQKSKFICIISMLLAILTILASCGTGKLLTDSSESSVDTTLTHTGPIELVKDNASEYVIIYGENTSSDTEFYATLLANEIRKITGVLISTCADSTAPSDKEILIGTTNREGCNDTSALGENDWSIAAVGDRIVILGRSNLALRYAVTYFVHQYITDENVCIDRTLNYIHKAENTIMKLSENSKNIKVYGRHSVMLSGITADWSAGGIEFNAECCGDISITVNSTDNTYFAAYVNGKKLSNLLLASKGLTTFKVAEGLDYGVYNIRLVKCANVVQANCILESVALDGKLLEAPKDKELLIEFIGDSITCGYGVIEGAASVDKDAAGTYKYCDSTSAFAYLTAQNLDADWRIEGFSGAGIHKGWTPYTVPEVYYTHTWTRDEVVQYDFASARVPDVIVINLGTNDNGWSTPDDFKEAATTFVTTIREKYGKDVPIVWAHGMMNETMSTHVEAALEALGGEESGYYTVNLSKDTAGGNGHPSAAGQKKAAEELTKFLKENVLK